MNCCSATKKEDYSSFYIFYNPFCGLSGITSISLNIASKSLTCFNFFISSSERENGVPPLLLTTFGNNSTGNTTFTIKGNKMITTEYNPNKPIFIEKVLINTLENIDKDIFTRHKINCENCEFRNILCEYIH